MEIKKDLGSIITFYSYKGGTGRSMALANVASLIARDKKKKVLVIDWDLEAPGLHRYFSKGVETPENINRPGVIDLFIKISEEAEISSGFCEKIYDAENWKIFAKALSVNEYIIQNVVPGVDFIKAGQINTDYPNKISNFDWASFYQKCSVSIQAFRNWISHKYDYCFIDSRTGFTDTSGICTTLLPEKLVLVFTPNNQSLYGVLDIADRAMKYRRASNDFRPLSLYPLPSRVDDAEEKLRQQWRKDYQTKFEETITDIYGLEECNLDSYFDEIKLPYKSYYGYGEQIAVLSERDEALSLHRAYKVFSNTLINTDEIWAGKERDFELWLKEGQALENHGLYAEALNLYLQELSNGIDDRETHGKVLINIGNIYQKTAKFEKAIQTFYEALPIFEKSNDILSQAIVLTSLGGVLQSQGSFDEAVDAFQRSYEISERLGDDRSSAMVLNSLGGVWQRQGKFDEAVDAFQRSYELYTKLGDNRGQAMVLNSLGGILQRQGNFNEAVDAFQRSYELSTKLNDNRSQAMILSSLGSVFQLQDKFDEAVNAFQQSYELYTKLGDNRGQAMVLNSLGGILQRQGKFDEAVDAFQRSYELSTKLDDNRGQAMVLNSLGGVLKSQGKFDEAMDAFQRSYELSTKLDDNRGQAMVLNSLGGVLQRQGKFEEAVDAFQRSYEISTKLNDNRSQAMVLNSLGRVLQQQDKFDESIHAYQRSVEIFEESDDNRGLAIVHFSMGKMYAEKDKFGEAKEHLLESFAINEKLNDIQGIQRVTPLLHQVLSVLEEKILAKEYTKRALSIVPNNKELIKLAKLA
ncbi:MAG: tetratricopeptide repeat protein [Chloroflexi bacterium]|nr:tetratricopeptide repeat protein [Chloroflexota bacterium]